MPSDNLSSPDRAVETKLKVAPAARRCKRDGAGQTQVTAVLCLTRGVSEPGEVEMPEPLSLALGAAKALGDDEPGKLRLWSRLLGPMLDAYGSHFGDKAAARLSAKRAQNVARILDKAAAKAGDLSLPGAVHDRVTNAILQDGSYCDDELMAEYLGGLLASGRTPSGKDDRAIAWISLVSDMSALQIRAHFLLYREWAIRLGGRTDLNLGVNGVRDSTAAYVDYGEFSRILSENHQDTEPHIAMTHAILGLVRFGLLEDTYALGSKSGVPDPVGGRSPHSSFVYVGASPAGIELFGWANGISSLNAGNFTAMTYRSDDDDLPARLTSFAMPDLQDPPAAATP